MNNSPLISIIMPVFNSDLLFLEKAIESCFAQTYSHWELCVCDNASTKSDIRPFLEQWMTKDQRIHVIFSEVNEHMSIASNKALAIAKGKYVTFLDHDDELDQDALLENVCVICDDLGIDFIYSDEDKIDQNGKLCKPFFKPDWSPDFLLSYNYIKHLVVIKKFLVNEVGGFDEAIEGLQDYDLILKTTEKANEIHHIPKILYHWRIHSESAPSSIKVKNCISNAGKQALQNAIQCRNIKAEVVDTEYPLIYRIKYAAPYPSPLISIIIPFKNKYKLLKRCVDSILEKSTYTNYELILVNNESTEKQLLNYITKLSFDKGSNFKVINYNESFNYARINDIAAKQADGDYLLFLNNDTEVIEKGWIEALLEHAQRKEIGAVGTKLLFKNNHIQHCGVAVGGENFAQHILYKEAAKKSSSTSVYSNYSLVVRNCSAVTGACMMIRKEVFLDVNGFEEQLKISFNDIDLCLKIKNQGYRIVYTPYAELYHDESQTRKSPLRNAKTFKEFNIEKEYCLKKWMPADKQHYDSFLNQNLDDKNYRSLAVSSKSKYFERYATEFSRPLWKYVIPCLREHGLWYTGKQINDIIYGYLSRRLNKEK